jgi:hypothetical protein
MKKQRASTSTFEDKQSESVAVPIFHEEVTATDDEAVVDIAPTAISQPNFGAAFAANPEDLTKALEELQSLLGSLEGQPAASNPTLPVAQSDTLWPEDLNTKQFRGTVEKAAGPAWGFDPGFETTRQ